jgi:single-strand DNA-binding protein
MKNITIAGRITKDAEQRTTTGGDKVTAFSVAVDDRSGKEKGTIFFDCNLWGARGDSLAQYLTKGSSVTVCGDLSKREHEGKSYLTVRVDNVTLQGAPKAAGGGGGEGFSGPAGKADARASFDLDDDLPFIRPAFSHEC